MLFKILCPFRIIDIIHKLVFQFARFQLSEVAKMAGRLLLITIILNILNLVTVN